jgi:protoheme IX farnesyltransferase
MRPADALAFGIILELMSLAILMRWVNHPATLLSFGGSACDFGIDTLRRERRTPQNIVSGGGAAAAGRVGPAAAALLLIVVLRTPAHLWSLTPFHTQEDRRAGVPMRPAARGPPRPSGR